MESTPMRNGAEEGGVLRSRDQKDFFEEKQLVILRAQHQAADCAKHVNLQRLMPRTDVHWIFWTALIETGLFVGGARPFGEKACAAQEQQSYSSRLDIPIHGPFISPAVQEVQGLL
ncbi:hypothetical protein NDU88_005376 [Pleurodeles waltl]|uniref:Uncharacterized protein n=1 Tax=Pleurodeles waltl TaxID=8319 RepID=A0AAV7LKX7_PLEWA|nr:hypothetical protein NDU88_005376 [Pleurodeles waltl]